MPNWDSSDDWDGYCVRCGRGYSFEVGMMLSCPHCGENPDYTDEQLVKQKIHDEEASKRALVQMQRTRAKVEFLHKLKAAYPGMTSMLDEIMEDVDLFEAEAVRTGHPPLYHLAESPQGEDG